MIQGKIRSAIQWIMVRKRSGVFHPGDICPKTGKPVLEVLYLKHPGARPPMEIRFESYRSKPTAFVPVDIINNTVASVARQLFGS